MDRQSGLALFGACLVLAAGTASRVEAAATTDDPFTSAQRGYWAFQPVERPTPPIPAGRHWSRNPIDAFVLGKLEAKGLNPAPPADKIALIRRASFDLVGLPPTPRRGASPSRCKS